MIVYVSHLFNGDICNIRKAKRITRQLQKNDLSNLYLCPITALSHLDDGDLSNDDEIELRLDLLSMAERLIVASSCDWFVDKEIAFAKLVKMEVMRLDENGELQPFTE